MPDEATQAPAEEQDTSATTAAPEEGTPAPESTEGSKPADIDFEQRYNDLRSDYDRRNNVFAAIEGKHGPEAQIEALRNFGIAAELDEEEQADDDEWEDPDDRLDRLEQRLIQKEEAEKEAHFEQLEKQYIDSTLDEIQSKENMKLSAAEKRIVKNDALANRLEDGRPNLQGAFDDLKGVKSAARDEYLASKKNAPKAPVGAAGEDDIDFSDPEAVRKWMVEDVEARMGAEES